MSGFLELHPDVLLHILRNTLPVSLLRCRLTCKALLAFIADSVELRYLIEIYAQGMIDNSRNSLSYQDKLELLRAQATRWATLDWRSKVEIKIPASAGALELVGGLFARTIYEPSSSNAVGRLGNKKRLLLVNRLPSAEEPGLNLLRHGLDFNPWDFTIDPTQDLLVLYKPESSGLRDSRLHLRFLSLSSREPHPEATSHDLVSLFHAVLITVSAIQVVGDVVAVFRLHSFLHIWNWKTGVSLVNVPTKELSLITSFTMLTDSSFLLTSSSGRIKIFSFETSPHPAYPSPDPPILQATLNLFRTSPQEIESSLAEFGVFCGPHQSRETDKPFRTQPEASIVAFAIFYNVHIRSQPYCLFVRNGFLASFADKGGGKTYDWQEWGPRNTRLLPIETPARRRGYLRSVCGQRVIRGPVWIDEERFFRVLDFSPGAIDDTVVDWSAERKGSFRRRVHRDPSAVEVFHQPIRTCLPYAESFRKVDEGFSGAMIDEDHIVTFKDNFLSSALPTSEEKIGVFVF